jgi:hypothetical protein
MWSDNFMEFIRFLSKDLSPFKIQTGLSLEVLPKRNFVLFEIIYGHTKLGIFWTLDEWCFAFSNLEHLGKIEKSFGIGKEANRDSSVEQHAGLHQQCCSVPIRPTATRPISLLVCQRNCARARPRMSFRPRTIPTGPHARREAIRPSALCRSVADAAHVLPQDLIH